MGEDEGMGFALGDGEIGDRAQIPAPQGHGAAQRQHMRASDRGQHAVCPSADPGNGDAIVEAQAQLDAQSHPPRAADHAADDAAVRMANGHEVDNGNHPASSFEAGVEHKAAVAIVARHARARLGRDLPAAMFRIAQKGRETGLPIESRQAKPIDGAVAPDERRRSAIADHGVVLDPALWPSGLSESCLQGQGMNSKDGLSRSMSRLQPTTSATKTAARRR